MQQELYGFLSPLPLSLTSDYLDMVCPVETMQKRLCLTLFFYSYFCAPSLFSFPIFSASPLGPSDVLSLTVIKTLPRDKQVIELMKKGIRFEMEKLRHYGALSLSLSLSFLNFSLVFSFSLSLSFSLFPPPLSLQL